MATTLFCWHTTSPLLTELEQGIALAKQSPAKSLLILSCNQNNYTPAQLDPILTQLDLPVCGGIYPLIIHQKNVLEQGSLIIGFNEHINIANFTHLSAIKTEKALEAYLSDPQYAITIAESSLLMFYDSLVNGVENFLDTLFELLDHDISIAGGGAGNLDFIQKPCIYSNQGLLSDTIQLAALPYDLSIGIAHGWETFKGPFLVSEAQGQTVHSLNYLPAFETYKNIIESESDYCFDTDDFFEIAKHFPLGIEDINHNLIVRDPILAINNQLQCLGNVPVNSMVYLLKSNIDSLIDSAKQAAITSLTPTRNTITTSINDLTQYKHEFSATMVFDCISRDLYMQEDFSREIAVIAQQCQHNNLFGVLSLGEIAKNKSGAIRLLNKSTVIISW
ncbi:FIST C-terminal domain-containing protein [Colwellia sp. D2M02]|uniref:FIST signal transduction protein n=1 Tax=Colwellia sp. D2M02 TaxID=2841562 RepID=UPI001C09E847|nr:FIST C-terminal domain-containing protein [Colwellia sp. D2M02]MBU2894608.1 FIST C-terminal domain-containing protein [Colwellia sp. D2M02]